MLAALKQQLCTNWHPMRWVALGLATVFGYNWLVHSAPVSGLLSLFFLYQAVFNTGCLGGQCSVPADDTIENNIEDIQYEEIKTNKSEL